MTKQHCYFCQITTSKNWIAEKHYLGKHGQTLKEVTIGTKSEEKRPPINLVYYCSLACLEKQMDQEDKELWAKGNCQSCGQQLAIINDNCHDQQHQQEACLLPIITPNCVKKNH